MKILSLFFATAVLAAGCAAAKPPVYAFDYAPPHRDDWRRTYAAARESSPLQCVFDDGITDARVEVRRDTFHSPTPADALRAYRIVLSRRGFDVADGVTVAEDGSAAFSIEDPAHRLRGEVIGLRVPADRRSVVLIGTWPAENDAEARGRVRALASNLFIRPVE